MLVRQFNYETAFSRNLGLVTEDEQARLRNATICIAGMGGVGGDYVATLARSGIGRFKLADFDCFELANFNRQYGATISTLGHKKVEVMGNLIADINPDAVVQTFDAGLTNENLEEFLSHADVVIDGIDLFVPDWHQKLISAAQAQGVPTVAAVPVGFGAGMVGFSGSSMSFAEYFDWDGELAPELKVLNLALGFAPAGFHLKYIDPSSVDLAAHRGPSSVAGCKLCAAMVGTWAIQAVLNPSHIQTAPWFTHIDLRLGKFRHKRLALGIRNPIQRLKKMIAIRRLALGS